MDPLHIHSHHLNAKHHHLLLLMLPTIVFVLVVALFMKANQVQLAKQAEEISVLGESSELDRETK